MSQQPIISKETGITEAQLSRFVNGHANLALPTLDKLIDCIGGRLVFPSKASDSHYKSKTRKQVLADG